MALSLSYDGLKNSKMVVRRLWNKLKSPKKDKIETYAAEEYVTDAAADYFFDEPVGNNTDYEEKNVRNKQRSEKEDEILEEKKETLDDCVEEEEGEEKEKQKKKKNNGTKNKSTDVPIQNITNIEVRDGNVHIGTSNVLNQTYYYHQAGKPEKGTKSKNHVKLSPEIDALASSKDKLKMSHVQFLSNHFGKSCRKIGLKLDLTNGELDELERVYKGNTQKISLEMLSLWMRRNGDKATLGKLCVKLWNSKIQSAREALQKLAENIDNFN